MKNIISFILGLFLLAGFNHAVIASVDASVDRDQISELETLRLVLSANQRSGEPDMTPLKKDFDVLGTSTSSRVSFVNGSMNSTYEWIVTLSPKRRGNLVIPSIKIGDEATRPINIKVKQQDSASESSNDIFLEVSISPEDPYVQSQVVYTIKIHHAIEIQDGGLSAPDVDNAIVEKLGEDSSFFVTKNGRRYRVTERKYAVFPQQSGPVKIPATVFDGHIIDSRQASRFSNDPFFRNYIQSSKPVRIRSRELNLNVLAKPDTAKGDWWLPAKKLSISATWSPENPEFRVGDPVTRTITLVAEGLTATQLPELLPAKSADFKFYPDQPKLDTTTVKNDFVASKTQKIAFVPSKAGKAVIPELLINWWDTKKNKARVVKVPATTINVLPALSGTSTNALDLQSADSIPGLAVLGNTRGEDDVSGSLTNNMPGLTMANNTWAWLTLLFFVMWILTVLFWMRQHRRNRKKSIINNGLNSSQSVRQAFNDIKHASQSNDLKRTINSLITWARLVWPDANINNVDSVVIMIKQDAIKRALNDLDRECYSGKTSGWNGEAFWRDFSAFKLTEEKSENKQQAIQALYPA